MCFIVLCFFGQIPLWLALVGLACGSLGFAIWWPAWHLRRAVAVVLVCAFVFGPPFLLEAAEFGHIAKAEFWSLCLASLAFWPVLLKQRLERSTHDLS